MFRVKGFVKNYGAWPNVDHIMPGQLRTCRFNHTNADSIQKEKRIFSALFQWLADRRVLNYRTNHERNTFMAQYRFKCIIPPYAGESLTPMPLAPILFGSSNELKRLLVSTRIPFTCVPESWKDSTTSKIERIKKIKIDDFMNISASSFAKTKITFLDDSGEKQWISPEIDVYFSRDLNTSDCGIFGSEHIFKLWEEASFSKDFVEYSISPSDRTSKNRSGCPRDRWNSDGFLC